jgi:HSP20 family molecular chaperone IbpA
MNGPLETNDMMVVTVRVPICEADQLAVSVGEGVIRVSGPDGYRHDVPLPAGADADRLHADLFRDVLELRAPRTSSASSPGARRVPVFRLV